MILMLRVRIINSYERRRETKKRGNVENVELSFVKYLNGTKLVTLFIKYNKEIQRNPKVNFRPIVGSNL